MQQGAADAGDVHHVVDFRFPVLGSPIDGVRNHGGNPFGDPVGGNHVEGFGVAWLQQQVHVGDALAELGPGLPAVFDDPDVGETVEHGVGGTQDGVAAALGAARGEP